MPGEAPGAGGVRADGPAAILRRLVEAVNERDYARLAALFAPTYLNHNPLPGHASGPDGAPAGLATMVAAFPDLREEAELLVECGDLAVARLRAQGTHHGAFMGVPATGRTVVIGAIDIFRVADGRIVEGWTEVDLLGILRQIGAEIRPGA